MIKRLLGLLLAFAVVNVPAASITTGTDLSSVTGSILPVSTASFLSLGDSTHQWNNVYAGYGYFSKAVVTTPANGGALAAAGTIATSTSSSRVQPAAAVTGVILQAGAVDGQQFIVINESTAANSITFAAAGTSNVADGTGSVIAGLTARRFIWTAGAARWFPEK